MSSGPSRPSVPARGAVCDARAVAPHSFDGYPGPEHVLRQGWTVGERVVVRFRDGDDARDALGHLTAVTDEHLTVETKRGEVSVPVAAVLAGRRVPPPPPPRAPRR